MLQVWFLSKDETCHQHSGLAITVGDCDWLIFFLLRGRTAKPYWCPPAVAGHCSRRHHSFLTG